MTRSGFPPFASVSREAETMTTTTEDFFVTVDGHRLAARWVRPETSPAPGSSADGAPPIVFLHEGLGSIGMWGDFPARLVAATGRPALLYDRYGHGGSDIVAEPRPVHFMEHEAWAVLPPLLEACGIETPILFAHSDGGTIALLYAARHPVTALVTEAAHIFVDEMTRAGMAKVDGQWAKGVLPRYLEPFHGDRAEPMVQAWLTHWRSAWERGWRVDKHLDGVTAPLLAIQGSDDAYGLPAQLDGIVDAVSGPVEKLFIEDCGHIPHQQMPDLILETTVDFLRRHGAV